MSTLWLKLTILIGCTFTLCSCIVVPESTQQSQSTTRIYVNERATQTQVEINRPQVIVIQPTYYPPQPYPPAPKPRCHMQSNGLSMPPFPVVCD
ncbi:hypothetical protein [Acinetobacter sp. MD2]|uniref:hypothetical protein n=1 Tax=Acinetobacter sp. MD2 TaxID=2600066 RepID=UPI002D1F5AF4|nr:hypothetical protein [Acinetobacter sp. MD2]MEB3767209.1 hypothetical protein [Acinetobacter sp. MD2]